MKKKRRIFLENNKDKSYDVIVSDVISCET